MVPPTWSDADRHAMERAIEIARPFSTHPNPRVGCVIVDAEGQTVGSGAHTGPGAAHAEVAALEEAGSQAQGGTAYVTLEPCAHTGRTPPCTEALIAAGVARVVAATVDPDERVGGRGIDQLRRAGLVVEVGLCEEEAVALDRAYHHHRATGLPWVQAILTPDHLGDDATAELDQLIATMDLIVTEQGPDLHPGAEASLEEQLRALGHRAVVELGVGDDDSLLEALARQALIDGATLFSRSSIPEWGPLSAGPPFTVVNVRSIGHEVRIEALPTRPRKR